MTTAAPPPTPPTSAAAPLPVPPPQDLARWLRRRQFAQLDEALNLLQHAFERRELPESDLGRAFRFFDWYRPGDAAPLHAWVEASPTSHAAHLALGKHLAGQAWWFRTYRRAQEVPEANWPRVARACEAASRHLHDAMRCTREPSLAAARRMNLNTIFAQDTWDGYVEAVGRSPTSLAVRLAKIDDLRPEWGGSIEGMHAFLGRPEHEALGEDDRAVLRATVLACEGHHLHHFQSEGEGAVRAFEASLEVRETARALVGLADALDGTDKDRIERSFRRALELEPLDQDARAQLGLFLVLKRGRFREGRRLLLQARREGSPLANDFYTTIPGGLNLLMGVLALVR